jgi:hypothetical protein
MSTLRIVIGILAIVCLSSVASASIFMEDFESYAPGSAMHGQGGWKGWNNTPGAGAPVSSTYAHSGSNSVEIVPAADLVHEFDVTGGLWILTAMQYIPSGTSGTTWFILLNTYSDNGTQDWSVQTQFVLDSGTITSSYDSGTLATIIYDQWVEIKCVIDLDNNTVDEYYDGVLITTHQWDNDLHDTLQVIDLYGNNASSVYYDDIKIEAPSYAYNPEPADGTVLVETWVTLKWSPGSNAVTHDLYLGEDFDAVNEGAEETFQGNLTLTYYVLGFPGFAYPDGLVPGTTYYWRVDEINDEHPDSPWRGDVWSFSIPPRKAHNPVPADGSKYENPENITLSWEPGYSAKVHNVFFGDNFDDVNDAVAGIPQSTTTYSPGPLEMDKTYYWRIDEFDGINTHKGDIWTFGTIPAIAVDDPNLVGWWTLDEGLGTTAVDWSGHNHHGKLIGDIQRTNGYVGGALEFDGSGDDIVEVTGYNGVVGTHSRTATAWIKTATLGEIVSWGQNSAGQKWIFRVQNSNGQNGGIRVEVNGGYQVGNTDVRDDQWHHVAAVLVDDGSPNVTEITLYLDGQPEAISAQLDEPIDTGSGVVRIGEAPWHDRPFTGLIDDVRIYDKALTQEEIQLVMRVDPLLAWNPSPKNASNPDIDRALPLSWVAGSNASQHEVYFGTDLDAVVNADAADTTGIYRGRQDATSYTPPEGVEWGGGPYFWRVDEVNTDGTLTKGEVWAFSVADFILVDDFEGYTNDDAAGEAVWQSWIDGFGVPSNGAQVGYLLPPYTEHTIVHSGSQSMPLAYNNATGVTNSEAELSLTAPRDWTQYELTDLSLWFRGDSANAAEPLYVAVPNATGADAVVANDDPGAAQITAWTEWIIPLQILADQGIDLSNVDKIAIGLGTKGNPAAAGGSGTMYIDDIRLYPPK